VEASVRRFGLIAAILVLSATLATAGDVAIRGGTILTVTRGTIEAGTILIRDSRIAAIGTDVAVPPDATVIDATGRFVMPGIIDGHSHIALDDDINEVTSPVTPHIDMATALVPDDYAIYRALAGGVTSTKLMHGSANVIGGVSVTVKLRWGRPLSEMVIAGARPQMKMALGENPKRVHGGKDRMPATRPAEFAVIRQSFVDARDYAQRWQDYRTKKGAGKDAREPKRDLKLETLAAVLEGEIAIDCHGYSAHELSTMLRIKEEFGLPLVAFSHALEAYKVRDEIAAHGVSVQTHTDWWGYKWEAYDAIPYAPAMLDAAGVNTTIISDSGDVMRRLNREAAKLVKYSGVDHDAALAMITINAARALEIDHRTGSIEVGKDADVAIFDRHPLDSFSRCVMTLIEGEVWFDADRPRTALLD
jgi:imidazolonepropionase-like amidohydrolase